MQPSVFTKRKTISSHIADSFDADTWYERLNLLGKLKRFCQICTGKFNFWLLVGTLTLVEPVLCSNRPVGNVLLAQVGVLAASSCLYIIQLIGVASREWDKILMIQALSTSGSTLIIPVSNFTPLKLFIFFTAEGEYILEFCCLVGGWCTIFLWPGLAVLRCFRVFRLLWFYEVEVFKRSTEAGLSPLFGVEFVKRGFKVLKFAIKSLTALGNEMFRLTNATKGGLLLMLIFFYSAFVMGTTLWIETGGEDPACDSFQMCTYTMMRLTFYDGTGFDFTYSLTSKHRFLFFLCIVYMCLTSFGILNGLVGIFGTAFSAASDDAFNDSDDEEEDEIENEENDEPDDQKDLKDVYTSFRGMYADDNNHNIHNASGYNNRRGSKTGLFGSHHNHNNNNNNNNNDLGEELYKQVDDDEDSDLSEMGEKIQPLALNATKQPSMSKMEVKALQHRLKGALGAKSNFAMMELTKMAHEPPPVKKPAAPRRTLRDIIQANKIGQGNTNVHPVLGGMGSPDRPPLYHAPEKTKPAAGGGSHHHLGMFGAPKKQQKNLHAAVGMFASLKKQKSSKGLHHAASHGNHGASSGPNGGPFRDYLLAQQAHLGGHRGSGIASTAEVKAINASVHNLQRTVETQSLTMTVLIKHIEFLSQQLYELNPTIVAKPIAIPMPENETKLPPRKFSNMFMSPRMSLDKAPTPPPEPVPQPATEPHATAGPTPAKNVAWGFGLRAAFTKSPPSSNNSSMYAIEKPTPASAPEVTPASVQIPFPAMEQAPTSAAAAVPLTAPDSALEVSAAASVPAVTPVVHVVEVHPAQSVPTSAQPTAAVVEAPAMKTVNETKELPVLQTQEQASPPAKNSRTNNSHEQDEEEAESPRVVQSSEKHSSPIPVIELSVKSTPAPVPSAEAESPAVSPSNAPATGSASVSPKPASEPIAKPQPVREVSPGSALDSLSLSRDINYRGPGIDLPKIAIGTGGEAGLSSPAWTPANIANKNKEESAAKSDTVMPVVSHSQAKPRPVNQGSNGSLEGLQEENQGERTKSPSESVKSAHKHRRKHGNNSNNSNNHTPAPTTPTSGAASSILGAMGKFKAQKTNPFDTFPHSALSKSPTVLDLPESEGGSLSDIWNPQNRPSTSPFKVHRHDARPSTTPNAGASVDGLNVRGGNQHSEAGAAADGARAGGERRANTGNGWLTEFSQNSTVGPDDVVEMSSAEQNV